MVRQAALALGIIGLSGGALAQSPAWTSYFKAVTSAARVGSSDKFAEPSFPSPPYGTVLRVPIFEAGSQNFHAERSAHWSYGSGVLSVTIMFSGLDEGIGPSMPWSRDIGLAVWSKVVPTGSYQAVNGFGARTMVTKYRKDSVGLAVSSAPFRERSVLHFEFPMSGAVARIATRNLALELAIGAKPETDRGTACRSKFKVAEMGSPSEIDEVTCIFEAPVTAFRIIRTDTGEVLADANNPDFDTHLQ